MSFPRLSVAALAWIFTAGLAPLFAAPETWTGLDGQKIQAEFLGRKGDYVTFKKADGSRYLYPYAKLTNEDQIRVDALVSPPAPAASADSAAPAERAGSVAEALSGKLVAVNGKSLSTLPRNKLNNTRYLAFYYSAHWCPPCRAFTPELVKAYKDIKAQHPEFELVFVSSDNDLESMTGYMKEYGMQWPALRFDQVRTTRVTRRPEHERGIPNLVFMDADGKELSVSYTQDGDYRGPQNVLRDIKKHFKM